MAGQPSTDASPHKDEAPSFPRTCTLASTPHTVAMRFFTQLIVALFSMLAAVDATGPSGGAHWKEWCSVGYPGMYNTINRFCSQFGSGFTVPNAKAAAGLHSSTAYKSMTWAGVTGNCNPPQWVPIVWCYTQFYHLCAC